MQTPNRSLRPHVLEDRTDPTSINEVRAYHKEDNSALKQISSKGTQ